MNKLMLAAVATLLASVATPATAADYDIVIRGGRVLDGAGNPWVRADVAIKNGRIAKVGQIAGTGAKEVDARGRYVAPGFIDMQDQSGRNMLTTHAESKLRQGVTTLIAGEAGTPVPAGELAGWFDQMDKQGIPVNYGTYYGAFQARSVVLGDRAGTPTAEQMAVMRGEVTKAMNAGAFGISTALIYAPWTFQTTADLIELAKVAGQCGGFYVTHMRDESDKLLSALDEAIEIGEKGGTKIEIYHLKAAYQPGWGKLMPQAVAAISAARTRGVDIAADMYVYTAGGTSLDITVPTWVWADGHDKGLERLKDPAVRARIKKDIASGSQPDWSNLVYASGGWKSVVLSGSSSETYAPYSGKSIADIAKALGKDPVDTDLDIILASNSRSGAMYFMMSEPDIETAIRQPWVSFGSDAAVTDEMTAPGGGRGRGHPRAFGNFVRVIAEYVKKRHVLTLEDAVRKLSGWPAQRLGLSDRGLIREGLRADVVVFDLDKLQDTATYDRPVSAAVGIDDVIVNGVPAIEAGRMTGAKSGMVLRHACTLPSARS